MGQAPAPAHEYRQKARAWDYHKAADNLLQTRTQSLLAMQSFLVIALGACVNAAAGHYEPGIQVRSTPAHLAVNLLWLLAVFGLIVSLGFLEVNRRLVRGITFLKERLVCEDGDIYGEYLMRVGNLSDPGGYMQTFGARFLPFVVPITCAGFWCIVLATMTGMV